MVLVLGDEHPIARVQHTCMSCIRIIEPGERYSRQRNVYDHHAYTYKCCRQCGAVIAQLYREKPYDWDDEGIQLSEQDWHDIAMWSDEWAVIADGYQRRWRADDGTLIEIPGALVDEKDGENDVDTTTYWHGGAPGLRPGDMIKPGHKRRHHDGCPWCEARDRGEAHLGLDGPSEHADRVYVTTEREYARFHASLYGYGDLYRVEPVGEAELSTEDSIESWMATAAQVIAVYDRAVLLTPSQRRRVHRIWAAADAARVGVS